MYIVYIVYIVHIESIYVYTLYIYIYIEYICLYEVYTYIVYTYIYIYIYIILRLFTIVHGLRVIVFGFPKKNLQYFERRVRHLAFLQGINRLPYILDFACFAWFDPRETLFSLHLGRIWCDFS